MKVGPQGGRNGAAALLREQAVLSETMLVIKLPCSSVGRICLQGKPSQCAMHRPDGLTFPCSSDAGDCFTAAFAVAVLEGKPYREAMRFATAAAALCIQVEGAMPSMPSRQQVGIDV